MPAEKRSTSTRTREAKRPYKYDVCRRGHDMRDPENVVVSDKGYENCRTCINERQRVKRARKRAVRVRKANRVEERAQRLGLVERGLGRQGDADRLLEVVRLRRDVQRLMAGVEAGKALVRGLRLRTSTLVGENVALAAKRRVVGVADLLAAGVVGMVLSAVAIILWIILSAWLLA